MDLLVAYEHGLVVLAVGKVGQQHQGNSGVIEGQLDQQIEEMLVSYDFGVGILEGGEVQQVSQHFLTEFELGGILVLAFVDPIDSASQLGN